MPGKPKQMLKDLRTSQVYESLYAAGKAIGPVEYAAGSAKNPAGKIKQDQHVWFAIHRDKDNVGRFQRSLDGGATFQDYPFTPSKRKSAAERKAKEAAKAGAAGTAAPAGETKEQRIARLRAELAATEAGAPATAAATSGNGAAVVEEDEAQPVKGQKLAPAMKVAKTA